MTDQPTQASATSAEPMGEQDFLPPMGGAIWRVLDRVTQLANAIGTLLIIAVMLLINSDVISRQLWNAPLHGVPELVAMSIVVIVFLQVPYAFRVGGLTRAELFLERLPRRAKAAVDTLHSGVGLWFCIILFNGVWPLFERAWTRNTYVGNIGDFTAPIWPVRLVILIGAALLGLQFFARALRGIKGIFSHE